jgi:hypothetical protein
MSKALGLVIVFTLAGYAHAKPKSKRPTAEPPQQKYFQSDKVEVIEERASEPPLPVVDVSKDKPIRQTEASKPSEVVPEGARRFNVRYQVPGILVNWHTLEIDYVLRPRFRLSIIGSYTRQNTNSDVALEYTRRYIGVAAHVFVDGDAFSNGLYLKPYMAYVDARGRVQDLSKASLTKSERGAMAGGSVVYQFVADTGVNLHLGVGLEVRDYPDRAEFQRVGGEQVLMRNSNTFPLVGEFTVGYAF